MPMRIAHVTSIHPDFDKRIWRYAVSLAASGCEIHLVCPWATAGKDIPDGIVIHPFERVRKRLVRPFLIPARILPILFNLRQQVDLFHFHDLDLLPLMTLAPLGKPVIYDVHENYPDEMLDRDYIPRLLRLPLYSIVSNLEHRCSRKLQNLVVVCPFQQNRFRSYGLAPFTCFNFASLRLSDTAKTGDYATRPDRVIFTGGHYESNGSLLLLEIASAVRQAHPAVKFAITDQFPIAPFRARFFDMAERLGVMSNLEVLEPVPPHQIMTLLNRATIAIAPNLRNVKQERAIPTKIFEYMAAGLPTVASDLPYVKDLFNDCGGGVLARPEDVSSFADAVGNLIADRPRAQQIGSAGRRAFIEQYNWEAQVPKLLTYYETILSRAAGAPYSEAHAMESGT